VTGHRPRQVRRARFVSGKRYRELACFSVTKRGYLEEAIYENREVP